MICNDLAVHKKWLLMNEDDIGDCSLEWWLRELTRALTHCSFPRLTLPVRIWPGLLTFLDMGIPGNEARTPHAVYNLYRFKRFPIHCMPDVVGRGKKLNVNSIKILTKLWNNYIYMFLFLVYKTKSYEDNHMDISGKARADR